MRIGINTLFYIPGEVGGSETYLCETLQAMLAVEPAGEFVLFTNNEGHPTLSQRFASHSRIQLRCLNFNATNRYARIVREQTQLPLIARKFNLDVLWSPGYTAPLLAPCPQVLSILDMQYKTHPQDLSLIARVTTDALVQLGARSARRIIALSEFSKTEIIRHTRIPAHKVVVTPLGVDPAFGVPGQAGPPDIPRPYLLCVANTYPHKNVPALISAYAKIQRQIPHHLVLVGKPRLDEAATQASLAEIPDLSRFHRIDGLDRTPLIRLYQQADLFVFPSLYEGFGLPVLEAMLAGTPVLTTRMGSLPEVGGDEVAYFDPSQPGDLAVQMMQVLAERDDKKIARAQTRAKGFTWERTARLTLSAFRQATVRKG